MFDITAFPRIDFGPLLLAVGRRGRYVPLKSVPLK
jgi:hypothetical protein